MSGELEEMMRKIIRKYLEGKQISLEEILRAATDTLYELAREGDKETFRKIMMAWQQLLLVASK